MRRAIGRRAGKREPVDLAVRRRAGKARQFDQRGRQHVPRQPLSELSLERPGSDGAGSGRDVVTHESLVVRPILPKHHDRLGDARTLGHHRFDLTGLDAVSAELDLIVEPAQKLQRAVRPPARTITGSVQPQPWRGRDRRRTVRRSDPAARGSHAPGSRRRYGVRPAISTATRCRSSFRISMCTFDNGRPIGTAAGHVSGCAVELMRGHDMRLGRAVVIVEMTPRRVGAKAPNLGRHVQRLAGRDDVAQSNERARRSRVCLRE